MRLLRPKRSSLLQRTPKPSTRPIRFRFAHAAAAAAQNTRVSSRAPSLSRSPFAALIQDDHASLSALDASQHLQQKADFLAFVRSIHASEAFLAGAQAIFTPKLDEHVRGTVALFRKYEFPEEKLGDLLAYNSSQLLRQPLDSITDILDSMKELGFTHKQLCAVMRDYIGLLMFVRKTTEPLKKLGLTWNTLHTRFGYDAARELISRDMFLLQFDSQWLRESARELIALFERTQKAALTAEVVKYSTVIRTGVATRRKNFEFFRDEVFHGDVTATQEMLCRSIRPLCAKNETVVESFRALCELLGDEKATRIARGRSRLLMSANGSKLRMLAELGFDPEKFLMETKVTTKLEASESTLRETFHFLSKHLGHDVAIKCHELLSYRVDTNLEPKLNALNMLGVRLPELRRSPSLFRRSLDRINGFAEVLSFHRLTTLPSVELAYMLGKISSRDVASMRHRIDNSREHEQQLDADRKRLVEMAAAYSIKRKEKSSDSSRDDKGARQQATRDRAESFSQASVVSAHQHSHTSVSGAEDSTQAVGNRTDPRATEEAAPHAASASSPEWPTLQHSQASFPPTDVGASSQNFSHSASFASSQTSSQSIPHASSQTFSRSTSSESSSELTCSACRKEFFCDGALRRHQARHLLSFECADCAKKFVRKDALASHRAKKHPAGGVRSREAAVCECGDSFVDQSALRRHQELLSPGHPPRQSRMLSIQEDDLVSSSLFTSPRRVVEQCIQHACTLDAMHSIQSEHLIRAGPGSGSFVDFGLLRHDAPEAAFFSLTSEVEGDILPFSLYPQAAEAGEKCARVLLDMDFLRKDTNTPNNLVSEAAHAPGGGGSPPDPNESDEYRMFFAGCGLTSGLSHANARALVFASCDPKDWAWAEQANLLPLDANNNSLLYFDTKRIAWRVATQVLLPPRVTADRVKGPTSKPLHVSVAIGGGLSLQRSKVLRWMDNARVRQEDNVVHCPFCDIQFRAYYQCRSHILRVHHESFVRNPDSGRYVKVGGPVWKALVTSSGAMKATLKRSSRSDLEEDRRHQENSEGNSDNTAGERSPSVSPGGTRTNASELSPTEAANPDAEHILGLSESLSESGSPSGTQSLSRTQSLLERASRTPRAKLPPSMKQLEEEYWSTILENEA